MVHLRRTIERQIKMADKLDSYDASSPWNLHTRQRCMFRGLYFLLRSVRLLPVTALALLLIHSATPASATCAVIGDSIAEGLRPFFRECRFAVQTGIGAAAIAARIQGNADVIVVSAGSNDYLTPGLLARLQALRSRAGSARVVWIRPIPQAAATAVEIVAQAHGDAVVPFAVSPTDPLHVHPLSSGTLAAEIRRHF
jgi:hypothetical protein